MGTQLDANTIYQEVYRMMQGDFTNYQVFYNYTVNYVYGRIVGMTQNEAMAQQLIQPVYMQIYATVGGIGDPNNIYQLIDNIIYNLYSSYSGGQDSYLPQLNNATEVGPIDMTEATYDLNAKDENEKAPSGSAETVKTNASQNNSNQTGYNQANGGQNMNAQNGYGQNANAQNGYGQNMNGQNAYGQNMNNRNANNQNMNSQNAYGQNMNNRNANNQNMNGQNGYGQNMNNRNGCNQNNYNQMNNQRNMAQQNRMPKKPMDPATKKKLILFSSIAAVIALGVLIFFMIYKPKVKLNDYVMVAMSGYDGYGKANLEFNETRMKSELLDKLSSKNSYLAGKMVEDISSDIYNERNYSISLENNISNGDELVVTWKIDTDKYKEKYGIRLDTEELKLTVSDLQKLKSFDPFEYVEVSFVGINGSGEANVNSFGNIPVYTIFSANPYNNLKNGDKITVYAGLSYDYDSSSEQEYKDNCHSYGYDPESLSKEYTVSGLEELKDFNAFDYLEISYSGVAPFGKVDFNTKDGAPVDLHFYASEDSGLDNGDKITVYVNQSSWDDSDASRLKNALYQQCYSLTDIEKEYEVSGLSYYVTSLSQIPEDTINKMHTAAYNDYSAYLARYMGDNMLEEFTLLGEYFLTRGENYTSSLSYENLVYMVYKVKSNGYEYYLAYRFTDVIIQADGVCSVKLDDYESITSESIYTYDYNSIYGYKYIESLYSDVITSNLDRYGYETTVPQ